MKSSESKIQEKLGLAIENHKNKKFQLAEKLYKEILALNKDHVEANYQLGTLYSQLQNFNLAQDRIENTLIRGGAQQQGPWGEFVLKNILDSVGLREGEEYETQKAYTDSEGNLQKPDVVVHMPGNRDIIIDGPKAIYIFGHHAQQINKCISHKNKQCFKSLKDVFELIHKKDFSQNILFCFATQSEFLAVWWLILSS